MLLSYSVVIRTVGNGGENYRRLLASIRNQTIPPEKVIVVIPYGCTVDTLMGDETIVYSEKGMVTQRAVGINSVSSEYMLVLDDDIEFGCDFVRQLYEFMIGNKLDCVLPRMGGYLGQGTCLNVRYPWYKAFRGAFTGQLFQSGRKSSFHDTVTMTAGHRLYYNNNVVGKCYLCQTGPFAGFFIKSDVARNVHFENEAWLQRGSLSSYAALDDMTFFYKLYLSGGRIAYDLSTVFRHLDSAAGHIRPAGVSAKKARYFTLSKNRLIFWYRFIFRKAESLPMKVVTLACGLYSIVNYTVYTVLINLRPNAIGSVAGMFIGYKEAVAMIRSDRLFEE